MRVEHEVGAENWHGELFGGFGGYRRHLSGYYAACLGMQVLDF